MLNLKETNIDELVCRAQANIDNGESFTEICRRFKGLVMKYARQNHLASIYDEVVSVGWLAVVEAVRSYDSSKGINFAGYVDSRVKYAIWNFFKKNKRRWQSEVPETVICDDDEISIIDLMPDNAEDMSLQVIDKIYSTEQIQKIKKEFGKISKKQQMVIKLTIVDRVKRTELARQMGITPQGIYHLQRRGLSKLRKLLGIRE